MLLSVNHCHENNIIHRDIKLENFLVKRKGEKGSAYAVHIMLSDFGLSCTYDEKNPPMQYCGTLTSMAPEIILGKRYNNKVDCYALGVALYELLTDSTPFKAKNKSLMK